MKQKRKKHDKKSDFSLSHHQNNENDDNFELNYDSDEVKSTESITEIRKKIENPRRIISLLNALNTVNLENPFEKEEFLKNLIDFEEKYGKILLIFSLIIL